MGPNYELAGFSRDELYWSQDELMGYVDHNMQENPAKGEIEVKDWIDKLIFPLITPVLKFLTPHNYERAKGTHADAYNVPSIVSGLAGEVKDSQELGLIVDGMSARSKKAVKMLMDDMKKKRQGPADFSAWDYRHSRKHEAKGSGFGETPPAEEGEL